MKQVLNKLINHEHLDYVQARQVLIDISNGAYNQSQIAAFLTVYMMRNIALDELLGFRDALMELCVRVDLDEFDTIDLCGTGGDGKNTFNISTLAAFVTAGASIKVTKHGNYGVSSVSGSSNVLEHLGIRFSNKQDYLRKCLDKAGICILHAPLFHPAMKSVAPIRRELGVKTFFNMLGPMVNPASPKNQLVGVFNLELARMYHYLYQNNSTTYSIVHALDGYDEISLTGPARILSRSSEQLLQPSDLVTNPLLQRDLYGGRTVEEAAKLFGDILKGKGTRAQQDVVCANAGLAIATFEQCDIKEGFEKAKESLRSGKALKSFESLQKLSE